MLGGGTEAAAANGTDGVRAAMTAAAAATPTSPSRPSLRCISRPTTRPGILVDRDGGDRPLHECLGDVHLVGVLRQRSRGFKPVQEEPRHGRDTGERDAR